jgi:uncharacterized repeat protein (TIGR01451 family)
MRKIVLFLLTVFSFSALKAQLTESDITQTKQLVSKNASTIGLTANDLDNIIVSSTYQSVEGIRMVYLYQGYKGIPVYNQMHVLAFRNDKVVSVAGSSIPGFEKMVNNITGTPQLTSGEAVMTAIANCQIAASRINGSVTSPVINSFGKLDFGKLGVALENITAELFWYPVNEKEFRLVWQVFLAPEGSSDMWSTKVDAATGEVLGKYNYTVYCNWHKDEQSSVNCNKEVHQQERKADGYKNLVVKKDEEKPFAVNSATYRVVKFPAESPLHPGGSPSLHIDPWTLAPGNATTLKWHNDGTQEHDSTRGNNVWAAEDRNNTNTVIDKAALSQTPQPNLTFDYVPDFTQAPTTTTPPNQQFNITNLFYMNNIMHDIVYQYGFNEVSGNFQNDNMGRGGAGNDYVIADAQDGGGTNNANFATPVDGTRPRMQMYLWTAPNPDRDGDVDNGIIAHEFGHGISNRLTGGPSNSSCVGNAEHGGEGWSDYYTLMVTTDWATATINDGPNPRGIGTYAANQPPSGSGIRNFRYSTDLSVNPLVYSATLPSQVHSRGEYWCAALWEMTWGLIQQTGINPNVFNPAGVGGNSAALKLVTEGMKLQPCGPGFIDARNAILKADTLFFGAQYSCAIWTAFAKRGMGRGASQGSANSVTDQVPSFVGTSANLVLNENLQIVSEGQNITYTNRVSTDICGPISNYFITDTLPTHVTYVSGGSYNAGNRTVTFSPITLPPATSQTYPLVVSVNTGSYFAPVTHFNETVSGSTIPATWTPSSINATVWSVSTTVSNSPPNSFAAIYNVAAANDLSLATTSQTLITPNTVANYTTLSFWHQYNTEDGWDGGVVEVSTDNGSSWTDLGSKFVKNGYNGSLGTGSNLSGRAAFTGTSTGFVNSIINLSSYANQSIKIRFRFGSDNNTGPSSGIGGWWVDDIVLYSEPAVQMRSSLFNASGARQSFSDTIARITVGCSPAAITTQPANVNTCTGATVTYTIAVSGTSPSFQWQVNTGSGFTDLTNTAPYSGVTTATLTITGVTAGMNGYSYRCLVSNNCIAPFNSNNASLNVGAGASINAQPINSTVCPGSGTTFAVTASAATSYQWQVNTGTGFTNLTNTAPYSGVTTATLTLSAATAGMNGYQYRCLVGSCATPLTSGNAILTVNTAPAVTTDPQNQTICVGSGTNFTVAASATGISYQWQVNTGTGFTNIVNGAPYSGATTSQLSVAGASLSLNGNQYRCVISGTCTPSATSAAAVLTVHAPVSVSSSPANQEICSGSNVTFTADGTSIPAIIYQWQVSTDGGNTWNNVSGANASALSVNGVSASLSGNRYRCLMSNATCTSPATSGAAILTVRQLPSVGLTAAPLTTLLPGQTTTLTATPTASTGGTLSATWLLNNSPIAVTGNTLQVNVTGIGTYQATIRETWTSGLVCSAQSAQVVIGASPSSRLFIFPSPNDGNFNVSYYNDGGANTQRRIIIYDGKGALVYDRLFTVTGLYTLIPVSIEKASRGIYMVVIGDAAGKKLAEGKVHIR